MNPAETTTSEQDPPAAAVQASNSPTRRSSKVSFPSAQPANPPAVDSPAHEKILLRKPTPFNQDLAATIKSSGISALMTRADDASTGVADPAPPVEESEQAEQHGATTEQNGNGLEEPQQPDEDIVDEDAVDVTAPQQ